uniref:LOW QUALITY PROTEIN: toll-like receptor 13 n=1 Tax=Podarcis muralis TaxID=64176 RepID=UPI0010A07A69|nr:LOW QUALITY PROTEIN: toll-like receptor 13 [Podarcis muralis]
MFSLRLLSTLFLFFSQNQRVTPYSFEKCEVHEVLGNRTKVLCYNRNLKNVPAHLPGKVDALDLSENKIRSLWRTDFRNLGHLQVLNISQNKIEHIEGGAFIHTSYLEFLNLTANRLTLLSSSMFDGLTNLTVLMLGSNQILKIEPYAFAHLEKLKVIDLSSNRLYTMNAMHAVFKVESLQELHIKDNDLQNFSTKQIISVPEQLRELDASHNPISLIDVTTSVLQSLSSLDLSFSIPNISIVWLIQDPCFLKGLKTLFLGGIAMKPPAISEVLQMINCTWLEAIHLNQLHLTETDGLIEQVCLRHGNVETLNLQHNSFTSVNEGAFENCTHLRSLNMAFNKLKVLPMTLFLSLHSLKLLSLANNKFTMVPNATSNMPSLECLDLSFNKIYRILPGDFAHLNNLKSLYATGNRISHVHSDIFGNLHSLQELNLEINLLTEINEPFPGSLKNLETLILRQNKLDSIKKDVFKNLTSLLVLNLADNQITAIEPGAFEGLSNLQSLVLGSNKITKDTFQEGLFQGLSSLVDLDLFNNYISYKSSKMLANPPFKLLKVLNKFNINSQRHNGLENFPVNFLQGLDSIVQIHAGNLAISFLDPKTFKYTPTLEELDLSDNSLNNVSNMLFWPVPNLRELHLNKNGLNSLSFVSHGNLSKLTLFRGAENQIDVITKEQIRALPALRFLDLRENTFACSCSNEMFLNWSLKDPKTQVLHFYQYICASPSTQKGQKLWTFETSSCIIDYGFILYITNTSAAILLMLVCFIYQWRLHMIYSYHLLLAYFIDKREKRKERVMGYAYDAFLSYNTHNEEWVINDLLPVLENQYHWKLCLHHRDFEPGRSILENIVDNIYMSRKTICIISRHYLESEWCSKEIQVASFRLFDENKDVLILIFLEDIPSEYLSPYHRMRKLIKKKTYLKWPQDEKEVALFWQKLDMAMKTGEGKEEEHPILPRFASDEVP